MRGALRGRARNPAQKDLTFPRFPPRGGTPSLRPSSKTQRGRVSSAAPLPPRSRPAGFCHTRLNRPFPFQSVQILQGESQSQALSKGRGGYVSRKCCLKSLQSEVRCGKFEFSSGWAWGRCCFTGCRGLPGRESSFAFRVAEAARQKLPQVGGCWGAGGRVLAGLLLEGLEGPEEQQLRAGRSSGEC